MLRMYIFNSGKYKSHFSMGNDGKNHQIKLAPVCDSNIIITGRISFWGNYFWPTPVSLWRSDLGPMGVSDHCYTRSDDLLAIVATGSMAIRYAPKQISFPFHPSDTVM